MTNSTTAWATVIRPPGAPKESQFGGSDRPVSVQINGAETKVFIPCGSEIERIQQGDHFVVEFRQGKWRYCSTQPPELLDKLRQRIPATPAMPPPAAPQVGGMPPPPGTATQSASEKAEEDAALWATIYQYLQGVLPDVSPSVLGPAASTIFIQQCKRNS